MAKICGIELKSSDAILALIEESDGENGRRMWNMELRGEE